MKLLVTAVICLGVFWVFTLSYTSSRTRFRSPIECTESIEACVKNRALKECVSDLKKVYPDCSMFYSEYE